MFQAAVTKQDQNTHGLELRVREEDVNYALDALFGDGSALKWEWETPGLDEVILTELPAEAEAELRQNRYYGREVFTEGDDGELQLITFELELP